MTYLHFALRIFLATTKYRKSYVYNAPMPKAGRSQMTNVITQWENNQIFGCVK